MNTKTNKIKAKICCGNCKYVIAHCYCSISGKYIGNPYKYVCDKFQTGRMEKNIEWINL